MVDAGLRQMVSLVVWGRYEPSCDTLPQPLTLTSCYQTQVTPGLMEALQHRVDDAYDLNLAFTGLRELLALRVFARYLLLSCF